MPPGSKSGTVRALLSATLAYGKSQIVNGSDGENVQAMKRACEVLGAHILQGEAEGWYVDGINQVVPEECELDAGNSRIVLRLLTAIGANMRRCIVRTSYHELLGLRGNSELVEALRQMGSECVGEGEEARPPLLLTNSGRLRGGRIFISGKRSSQFLSSLLFLSPLVGEAVELVVADTLTSRSAVELTIETLRLAGIHVEVDRHFRRFRVEGGQRYQGGRYVIASDVPSIAGILGAAAVIPNSEVCVKNVMESNREMNATIQALEQMGVKIERGNGQLLCYGTKEIVPICLDGSACPDSILPLVAVACFARGMSRFYNIETLRLKACDRISDFRRELLIAGADVEEEDGALIVNGHGRVKGGTEVQGCYDYGVVMALAAIALRSEQGVMIRGVDTVEQSYPRFLDDLKHLGAEVMREGTEVLPLPPDASGIRNPSRGKSL